MTIQRLMTLIALTVALGIAAPTSVFAASGSINITVTSKKKKYKRNTLVHLVKVPGKYAPPAKGAFMDQKNQKFKPFVLPILKGTKVTFRNSDATGHNVFSPDNEKYDLGVWGKGQQRTYVYKKSGVYTQLCRMHPSMIAYVVVLDNPFFAVTNKAGVATIKNVPAGSWTVKVWNERRKADKTSVKVAAGAATALELKLHR